MTSRSPGREAEARDVALIAKAASEDSPSSDDCWCAASISLSHLERRGVRRLLSGPTEHDPEGPDDDDEVETQGPAIDVVDIESNPVVE